MKSKSVVVYEFRQLLRFNYAENTIESYCYYIFQFLDFSNNSPLRVTNKDILNYNISLVQIGVSDSTRNIAISGIKLFFTKYLKKKIDQDVVIRPSFKKKVVRHINHDFLIYKLNKIENTKAELMLKLGYGCGLRSNEVLSLKRKDINLKEKFIIVNGKGSRERKLPISDSVINLIIKYGLQYRPVEYLFNGQITKGIVKPQYSSSSLLALVKKNIGNYRFHDLRHSYAMFLYNNGTPLEQLRKLLGHKKTETTEIYAYANENMLLKISSPVK